MATGLNNSYGLRTEGDRRRSVTRESFPSLHPQRWSAYGSNVKQTGHTTVVPAGSWVEEYEGHPGRGITERGGEFSVGRPRGAYRRAR